MSARAHAPLLLVLVAGCTCATRVRPPPEIQQVVPSEVEQGTPVIVRVEGAGFYANLRDPFWSGRPATVDARFRVWVGDVELPAGAVTQVDATNLDVALPADLPLGLYPVRVRTPAGSEASLADALAVVDSVTPVLLVEDRPGGWGASIGARDLIAGDSLSAYAIRRSADSGRYLGPVRCTWALTVDVGDLDVAPLGTSVALTLRRPGVAQLVATPLDGSAAAASGDLRVTLPQLSLAFATPPQRLAAGVCSSAVTLELRDVAGNRAAAPDVTPLSLSSAPAGGSFYSDAACGTAISAGGIPAGRAATTLYVRATVAGAYELSVDSGWYGAVAQSLDVDPAPASTFTWAAIGPQISGKAFAIALSARDDYGNLDSTYAGSPTLSLAGEGLLSCVAGCTGLAAGPFSSGAWSGTVSITSSQGGTRALQARDGACSGASGPFTLVPPLSPPLALLAIRPGAIAAGDTTTLDASGSSDYQTPATELKYSFDFEGNAVGPPPWTPWSTSPSITHAYPDKGYFTARVAVEDADGNIGYGGAAVVVLGVGTSVCVVTSPSAAVDDGASACTGAPGPDGVLSLAEALRLAAVPLGAGIGVVLPPGLTVTGPADLIVGGEAWVMGGGDARLVDVSLHVPDWATLTVSGVTLESSTAPITVGPFGLATLEGVRVRNAPTLPVEGMLQLFRSELTGCAGPCVALIAGGAVLIGRASLFAGANAGVDAVSCSGHTGVDVVSCAFANLGVGVRVQAGCTSTRIVNDTFHGNGVGIAYSSGSGHELRNAVFSENATAVECGTATFQTADSALLWKNADAGCAPADPATFAADPLYLAPEWSDYRLNPNSPAVNSGADAGVDVNDLAPGAFTGTGPDRGGRETW